MPKCAGATTPANINFKFARAAVPEGYKNPWHNLSSRFTLTHQQPIIAFALRIRSDRLFFINRCSCQIRIKGLATDSIKVSFDLSEAKHHQTLET